MSCSRLFALVSLCSLASSAALANPIESAGAASSRVVGGELSEECAWPSVLLLGVKRPEGHSACTGTLVHPRVILFAAHCGTPEAAVLGTDRHAPLRIKTFAKWKKNPQHQDDHKDTHADWAFILLEEPIAGAPITPIVAGCEVEMLLKKGESATMVGFSDNSDGQDLEAFKQRFGQSPMVQVGKDVIQTLGGNQVHGGDSGGPLMRQLPDGSWRTLGIASQKGVSGDSWYARNSASVIAWVNKETGLDIAPCFDETGKPTSSKACDEFMAFAGDPKSPQGEQAEACSKAKTVWAGLACGVEKSDGSSPGEPDKSKEPDETPEPGKSKEPDKSPDPGKSKEPDKSNDPGKSKEPDGSKDSGNSKNPDPSKNSENSSEPEASPKTQEPSGQDSAGASANTPQDPDEKEPDATSGSSANEDDPVTEPSQDACAVTGAGVGGPWLLSFLVLLAPWFRKTNRA